MRLHFEDGRPWIMDLHCCGPKRRWRALALAFWFAVPVVLSVLVLRWDVERTQELAQAKAMASLTILEARCWKQVSELVNPPRTTFARGTYVKGCIAKLEQGQT